MEVPRVCDAVAVGELLAALEAARPILGCLDRHLVASSSSSGAGVGGGGGGDASVGDEMRTLAAAADAAARLRRAFLSHGPWSAALEPLDSTAANKEYSQGAAGDDANGDGKSPSPRSMQWKPHWSGTVRALRDDDEDGRVVVTLLFVVKAPTQLYTPHTGCHSMIHIQVRELLGRELMPTLKRLTTKRDSSGGGAASATSAAGEGGGGEGGDGGAMTALSGEAEAEPEWGVAAPEMRLVLRHIKLTDALCGLRAALLEVNTRRNGSRGARGCD